MNNKFKVGDLVSFREGAGMYVFEDIKTAVKRVTSVISM